MSINVFAVPESPLSTVTTDFRKVTLTWNSPTGTFTRFRIVRSQSGFPETAEDGVVIFDEFSSSGTVSRSTFTDGEDNPGDIPLVPGRQVYYRVFLFTSSKIWVNAGGITAIVPGNHNSHSRLTGYLPRVFTSKEQSPLDAINQNSALYEFLWGFSFTEEELLTYLDLLKPRHTGLETPVEILPAEVNNVGLVPEPGLPTKNQKRLVREALYMYSHKGTLNGLQTYAEALTGFAPTINVSTNLMLTPQDSTFYQTVGSWTATNATIESTTEMVPTTNGVNVIDEVYAGKIVASSSGVASTGTTNPIELGVPVTADTEYTVSAKIKSPTSAGNMVLTITWYTKDGVSISTSASSSIAANNTWKDISVTATAPSTAKYASVSISYSAAGTYYLDMINFRVSTSTTYDEARAVDIFLNFKKANYINNPSFENNVTDSWTLAGSATASQDSSVSDQAYSGTSSAKIVATGNWTFTSNSIPVNQGQYYTASGYVKTDAPLTVTFVGRDSLGNLTSHVDSYPIGTITDWARFSATDLLGAGEADVAYYDVQFSGDAGTYYIDCVQFESSHTATDYFDGSLPEEFGAEWQSTANNSTSVLYPNKPTKIPRLAYTLTDWLPMNTFWRVRTYDGVEYTNLTV